VNTPKDTVVVGLKELPESTDPLVHTHIFFAHCYKNQAGWQDILSRFQRGNGLLLDLEFLVDDAGRRVAAFGRPAGTVGAALGVLLWVRQQTSSKPFGPLLPWKTEKHMVDDVRAGLAQCSRKPRVCVIGALGRCGKGSADIIREAGITEAALWDLPETKKGGPFPELMDFDIVINCIYLSGAIPPFITQKVIDEAPNRKTTVIVDVSCDTSNPHNPLPIYSVGTTLKDPVLRIKESPVLDVIAIDHLPTLNPRESSDGFATDLLPHLLQLNQTSVWTRAVDLFHKKLTLLPKQENGVHGHHHHHHHENGHCHQNGNHHQHAAQEQKQ